MTKQVQSDGKVKLTGFFENSYAHKAKYQYQFSSSSTPSSKWSSVSISCYAFRKETVVDYSHNTWYFFVREGIGTPISTKVVLDNKAPTVTIKASTTALTNKYVTLTIVASDAESGLNSKPYSWDGKKVGQQVKHTM